MKHLTLHSVLVIAILLTGSTLPAAVPLHWTVETSRSVPAQFEAYQGETIELEAALQSYGKPLEAPSNYSLYWQTNGMGSAYWSVPCTPPNSNTLNSNNSNTLFATWSPTNDVGAKVYNCFIGQPGTIYHAAFQLRLRPSPGATPNDLPLPTPVIDFAKVRVLNPPWGSGGGGVDTNAVRDIIRDEITPSTNSLYATLNGSIDIKRDKADRAVYSVTRTENTDWTWESENKELEAALNEASVKPIYDSENHFWVITGTTHWGEFYYNSPGVYDVDALSVRLAFITIPDYVDYYATATRPRYMDETLGPAKPNQQLAAVATDDAAKPADGSLMKYDAANDRFVKATAGTDYADEAKGTNRQVVRGSVFDETKWNISVASSEYAREAEHAREAGLVMWSFVEAKPTTLSGYGITDGATTNGVNAAIEAHHDDTKRDLTDNTCYETEFWEWSIPKSHETLLIEPQPKWNGAQGEEWIWRADGYMYVATGTKNSTELDFYDPNPEVYDHFTSKRAAVCVSNDTFVTWTPMTNAISEISRTVTPPPSPNLRVYDEVRQCWWVGKMVNGVINWEVE